MRILITGSSGLVGHELKKRCESFGHKVVPLDIRRPAAVRVEDICDHDYWRDLDTSFDGIVHLAAISRVAWGELRPDLCHSVNVLGTRAVIDALLRQTKPGWLLFASSREVYGNVPSGLVTEDAPLKPVNHYGRSKAEGEAILEEARRAGLTTAVVRLSNVYGSRRDHPDRAIPSLVSNALSRSALKITGPNTYFDFVHVDDVVAGLIMIIEQLSSGKAQLPTLQLTTGVATSLRDLAELAIRVTRSTSEIVEAQARSFDVRGFCGSAHRASKLLGWTPQTDLRLGVEAVANSIRVKGPLQPVELPDPANYRSPIGT